MKRTSQALPWEQGSTVCPELAATLARQGGTAETRLQDLRDVKPGGGMLAAMGQEEGNIPAAAGPTVCPTADQQTSVELLCLY